MHFFFQLAFANTAVTIVSGSMAERTTFSSYMIYSSLMSIFTYPMIVSWIGGHGWLYDRGFIDFAGASTVHYVGGLSGFIGAKIIGPRFGKFDKKIS